jgi:hypothetical protein
MTAAELLAAIPDHSGSRQSKIPSFLRKRLENLRDPACLIALCAAIAANALHAPATAAWLQAENEQRPVSRRLYSLASTEAVYAYARISPNGRFLAYAARPGTSVPRGVITPTISVVDLETNTVLFTEPGVDAYWSPDGLRMIFMSMKTGLSVALRHQDSGLINRDVAPVDLGDYFSWGIRDGNDVILTILSNYFVLTGDVGMMPSEVVPQCPGIGMGERPLLSKDGRRITTFVRGNIVVRNLADCDNILDTGTKGAKADFSWDGRYIAFHSPKRDGNGYCIKVIDTQRRTVRTVVDLQGSSFFPSWTRDGRLCFRYDGDDYSGFMMVSQVLSAPEVPLAAVSPPQTPRPGWFELFPSAKPARHKTTVVTVWAPWSAHSSEALLAAAAIETYSRKKGWDVGSYIALEPSSRASDAERLLTESNIRLPNVVLDPHAMARSEAVNQIPFMMLFRDGTLVDRQLGAQSSSRLISWIESTLSKSDFDAERHATSASTRTITAAAWNQHVANHSR